MQASTSRARRALTLGGAAAALSTAIPTARAQSLPPGLPNTTIRILVGFPPGGGTDVMARYFADKLRERTGLNVLVENRAGASGAIAIDALKKAPTDGSVIMYGTSATTVALPVTRKNPGFNLEADMTPIGMTGATTTCFVVSSTLGVKNLPEYLDWLKKNPNKNTFGTTAPGSNTHFFGVLLGQAVGTPLEFVAYKGAGPLLSDLFAGHVPAGCGGVTDFLTHHKADKVRIIAISSPKRLPFAPDLPTVSEMGHPSLNYEGFYGFYGPPKMPAAVVEAWSRELAAAADSPDLKKRLYDTGLDVQTTNAPEFLDRQRKLVVSFTDMMKRAGYTPE
jgi:tripartite-type tricarboxylate transporter receptor subunit TctC